MTWAMNGSDLSDDEPSGDPADPRPARHMPLRCQIIKSVDPNIQVFANPYDWKTNEQAKTTILGMGRILT